ncbi:type VII secretion protein EccB [Actinoplanes sp. CA-054009]
MQTQRDHVHAHQFMMGRLSSALVKGDPTSAEIPGQRALTGLLFGILAAVLVVAGFAVYGWIVPGGSTAYTKAGQLLVEKETGNRYVYAAGSLRPVANVTTASLLLGSGMKVKLISRSSLAGVPRGGELGDYRWPQSVVSQTPVAGPWLVCLPGSVVAHPKPTALGLDLDPAAEVQPIPADRFAVVRSAAGASFVIFQGHKLLVRDKSVLVALGAGSTAAPLAPANWLAWLPDGPKLGAAVIPGAGTAGPKVGGRSRSVGTLFWLQPASGPKQYFVLRSDGLAPISPTEFQLAAARPGAAAAGLTAAQVVAAEQSTDRTLVDRLPDLTGVSPQPAGGGVLCQRQAPNGPDTFQTLVGYASPERSGVNPDGTVGVVAAPGTGMTAAAVPHAGTTAPLTFIAESGVAYPVADQNTQRALGLGTAVPFPASLLALLPKGPALSQKALTGHAGG